MLLRFKYIFLIILKKSYFICDSFISIYFKKIKRKPLRNANIKVIINYTRL